MTDTPTTITPAADDVTYIRQRMAEIKKDQEEAEKAAAKDREGEAAKTAPNVADCDVYGYCG